MYKIALSCVFIFVVICHSSLQATVCFPYTSKVYWYLNHHVFDPVIEGDVEAEYGAECCFSPLPDQFASGIDVHSSGRIGYQSDGSARLTITNLAQPDDDVLITIDMIVNTEPNQFYTSIEVLDGATVESPAITDICEFVGGEDVQIISNVDLGDGFKEVRLQAGFAGVDLSDCDNIHIVFDDLYAFVDQVFVEMTYFENGITPIQYCTPGPPAPFLHIEGFASVSEYFVGSSDTFYVSLISPPDFGNVNNTVAVNIEPVLNGPGPDITLTQYFTNLPMPLTFDGTNWDIPQEVVVTALDDILEEDCIEYLELQFDVEVSNPFATPLHGYSLLKSDLVQVKDNDMACVFVNTGDGVSVNELDPVGSSDDYTIVLNRAPLGGSTNITLFSEDFTVQFTPGFLYFSSFDWDVPKTVTVSAIQDDVFTNIDPVITAISSGEFNNPSAFNPIENVVVQLIEDECGEFGLPPYDLNGDCRTDLDDFSLLGISQVDYELFVTDWLNCTHPDPAFCN